MVLVCGVWYILIVLSFSSAQSQNMVGCTALECWVRLLLRDVYRAHKFHHGSAVSSNKSRGGECLLRWNGAGIRLGPLP